jgi:hypothetical protein
MEDKGKIRTDEVQSDPEQGLSHLQVSVLRAEDPNPARQGKDLRDMPEVQT